MSKVFGRIVNLLYRPVHPYLSEGDHFLYAGVKIGKRHKIWDHALPASKLRQRYEDRPRYEEALVEGLRREVRPGDRVTVVGGGLGVTATIAALQTGPSGKVICFEGDELGCREIKETARLNGVSDRLSVEYAVVAENIRVYGEHVSTAVVSPAALAACDVLELDCEGAEIAILRDMTIRPRVILVETHGCYGAPSAEVGALLERIGYEVADLGWAEPTHAKDCTQGDIRVLSGRWPSDGDPTA